MHLAKAGLLNGKKYTSYKLPQRKDDFKHAKRVAENVIVDGNIVTAKAVEYVDLALELGKIFNIYKDEADYRRPWGASGTSRAWAISNRIRA